MSIFLSKLLPQLIYPVSLTIWLAIFAGLFAWRGHKRLAGIALFLSVALLWVSSMRVTADYLSISLERKYLPVPIESSPVADAVVVLGGGVATAEPPRLAPDLDNASDRVLHAARLYRAEKAPVVIVSGGVIAWQGATMPEAIAMKTILQEWGVPATALIMETNSLNTYQNAVETKRILEKQGLNRVLLVTSASHMPRALATFRSAGINAIPSPTDFEAIDRKQRTILDWLPEAKALGQTTSVIKEYMGIAVYRWRGWIKEGDSNVRGN
ncbi:MAG: YdcF family protein [Pseudomonadota bacterium]